MMDGDVLEINKTELNEEEEEDEKSSDSLEELSDAERLHSVTAAAHAHTHTCRTQSFFTMSTPRLSPSYLTVFTSP